MNFNTSGSRDITADAKFRILVDGIPIPRLEIRALNSGGFYNASIPMYPLEVIPGSKIKFSVQWFRLGLGYSKIYNDPSNSEYRRYLTIID